MCQNPSAGVPDGPCVLWVIEDPRVAGSENGRERRRRVLAFAEAKGVPDLCTNAYREGHNQSTARAEPRPPRGAKSTARAEPRPPEPRPPEPPASRRPPSCMVEEPGLLFDQRLFGADAAPLRIRLAYAATAGARGAC